MITVTVQIGNSDDKLTQMEWSRFVNMVSMSIHHFVNRTHFMACSDGSQPWQNAAWIFEIEAKQTALLKIELVELRELFRQDSIAYLEGETKFI